jgi:uncharacterized membrane protein
MNGKGVLFFLLAMFALIGVWGIVSPVAFITWFKSARPDLRDKPNFMNMEDNPAVILFVRFFGTAVLAVVVVIFVAFVFAR